MSVTGAPGTGVITLNTALPSFQSFAAAGVVNAEVVRYLAVDGSNFEINSGAYTASGMTLARGTPSDSSSGGTLISLTANAQIFIIAASADLNALKEVNATSAQFVANNLVGSAITVDQFWAAGAYVALTDAATIALDLSTGINFTVTLGGNRTLGFPTLPKVSQSGYIEVVQDGTGGRTLSFASGYKFDTGAAPSIDTTAGHKTMLFYTVRTTGLVIVGMPFLGCQ